MDACGNSRPTIGLFITSAEDKYENAVFHGVFDVTRLADCNLICYTSGALRSYHGFEAQRNVLYELVSPEVINGLVVSGTLSHNVSMAEMQTFCVQHQPMVTIGINLENIPSVSADCGQGMREVVAHLIETHGYRRIVFVRGPAGQQEADERYRTYCDSLQQHGIAFNPNLVLKGDFTRASGVEAMQAFLAKPGLEFEAVVCANDSMALGVVEVLQGSGKCIPDDVAVCGFDDTEEGRFLSPALTTVRQSVYEQSRLATNMLLMHLAGQTVADRAVTPTALVLRRSCGCKGAEKLASILVPWEALRGRSPADDEIVEALRQVMSHLPPSEARLWAAQWLEAFACDLAGNTQTALLDTLESTLSAGLEIGVEVSLWNAVLTALHRLVLPGLGEPALILKAEELFEQGRARIAEVAEKLQVQQRTQIERQAVAIREIGETLATTTTLTELLDVLAAELPRLDIHACFLSLYDNPHAPVESARLVLAYDQSGRLALPPEGLHFPSPQLAPALIWERLGQCSLIVEALYSKEDQLGFVLFEVSPDNVAVCSELRGQMSSALQGVLLLQERRRVEAELLGYQVKLEEKVMIRTRALRKANAQLQKEITERIQAQAEIQQLNTELEQRVADRTAELESANHDLEAFSYSVSHDLRAPLRTIDGFSSILRDEYADKLGPDGLHHLERVRFGIQRMTQLIDDLLKFSRLGRQTVRKQPVTPTLLVRQALEELRATYGARQVEIEVAELPPCQADPALLRQVFENLIGNAIKYTGKRPQAHIQVGWLEQNGEIVYFVRDNGAGFDMRYASKLFGVFQRLHRDDEFEGTGVGLATVQRIVSRHGGRIWAEAQVDHGATFYFTVSRDNK